MSMCRIEFTISETQSRSPIEARLRRSRPSWRSRPISETQSRSPIEAYAVKARRAAASEEPSPRPSLGAPLKRPAELRIERGTAGAISETQSRSPIEAPGCEQTKGSAETISETQSRSPIEARAPCRADAGRADHLRDPVSEPH